VSTGSLCWNWRGGRVQSILWKCVCKKKKSDRWRKRKGNEWGKIIL